MRQHAVLQTKLHIPPLRAELVPRPRPIARLNEGLRHEGGFWRKLTVISAPAGFGKTTLLSEWVAACQHLEPPVGIAWLSLDEGDSDPTRFLVNLIAALRTVAVRQPPAGGIGEGLLGLLQSPQPPPAESVLTTLPNEITAVANGFALVLDDYHVVGAQPIDRALNLILDHLPPQMHLLIATREDPHLPLARLRARAQLAELRVEDLRFTPAEAAEFLNRAMGLGLCAEDVAALEARTEGWIAGLQLAALAVQGTAFVQGRGDPSRFVRSFAGSHRFVMNYLVDKVLQQQPANVQAFFAPDLHPRPPLRVPVRRRHAQALSGRAGDPGSA